MSTSRSCKAARNYLERGWQPIPVPHAEKSPGNAAGKGWQRLRLTAADLLGYFGDGPMNIGILLGAVSGGLMDVDLDCAEALVLADTFLPATDSVFGRAGKPRSHRLYLVGGDLRTERLRDLDGSTLVELRGAGGQTVFPPSTHPCGEIVAWFSDGSPAPAAPQDIQSSVRRLAAAVLLARHWPAQGARHDAALALGGWLARAGWTLDDIETFVGGVTRAGNDEESEIRVASVRGTFDRLRSGDAATGGVRLATLVGDLVVKKTAGWLGIKTERMTEFCSRASRRKRKRRAHVGEFDSFPVRWLPEPIRSFVTEFSESLGCDPAYLAVPVLGVLAAAIGNTRTIRLKVGWTEPAVIWALVIAPSGTLKSPALDAVLEPVHEFQLMGLKKHRDAVADHKQRMASHKRALKEFKQGKTEEISIEPDGPVIERFFCEDTTVEALAVVLSDALRGMLLSRDELSGWLRSFNQYRGGRGGDEAHWLAMHGARTLTVDRKTGDKPFIHVPRAALCIVGGIQPGVLASSLSQDHMHSGMAARMLFAYPPRRKKQWSDAEASDWTKDDYKRIVRALYELQPQKADNGVFVPVQIPLAPDAKAAWIEFYNQHAAEQVAMTGATAAAWSKLEGYAARLALVVHCVRVAHNDPTCGSAVDLQSIQAGIALSRWFGSEALRVYAMLQVDEEDRELHERLEVVRSLGGQVTVRDWHRRRKLASSEIAEAELDELVETELGTWRPEVPGGKGGRPQKWFVATSRDKTPNSDDAEGDLSVSPSAKREKHNAEEGSVYSSTGHTSSDSDTSGDPATTTTPLPEPSENHFSAPRNGDTDNTPDSASPGGVSSPGDADSTDSTEGEV